jgi:hypothetical protein
MYFFFILVTFLFGGSQIGIDSDGQQDQDAQDLSCSRGQCRRMQASGCRVVVFDPSSLARVATGV